MRQPTATDRGDQFGVLRTAKCRALLQEDNRHYPQTHVLRRPNHKIKMPAGSYQPLLQ